MGEEFIFRNNSEKDIFVINFIMLIKLANAPQISELSEYSSGLCCEPGSVCGTEDRASKT